MGGSDADTAIHSAIDLAVTIGETGVLEEGIGKFEARIGVRAREKILHSFSGGQTYWLGRGWTEYEEMDL
jgi:hypothetical protein